ncbi:MULTISPECIES: glycogen synthase GlgA [unclassified Fusibacter]|uniref:glycogen synthase GlgA n=1 Tax=unclassified Fusibacter TaxID=2624464 RepID=UPI001012F459|nr:MULTISPECIES: glycogen synthase GlgA [unclassified Fusibacter]MCK8061436.1 glycogen synthase GlgA [Fusibacter sp. A2]NPE23623.1 glycogen synthase GlgA [Fusibacter sp. A1]RXV58896.1 glycogen synthase GlgA [Fusibacter sp. A1]
MKILFVASEAVPFAKTGGLADVAYSLPKALTKAGHDVRIVMPKYKGIKTEYADELEFIKSYDVQMNWRHQYAGVFMQEYNGLTYYFIDNEYYFKRDGFYGYYDDGERFAFYSKAVLDTVCADIFVPDIIHVNDWHTAPIALLVKDPMYKDTEIGGVKTVFTIHNLKYQGIFPINLLSDFYGIDDSYLTYEGLEFNGNLNFMKAGLVYADAVTTVSKTYANEIRYPYYGEQLENTIGAINHKMSGIINGLDYGQYNPSEDKVIFEQYDMENAVEMKRKNKMMLQRLLRLKCDPDIPMIGMVTRLVEQKGIDLLLHVVEELMQIPMQVVVLGTGDKKYEDALKSIDSYHPEMMSANIYFDNTMASRIYASADLFLMPSLVEPCGIGQMIAMRYGAIPVVRQTGGLMDTIDPFNKYDDTGSGFGFLNANAHEMLFTIKEALSVYEDKPKWKAMVKRAMSKDLSWDVSADKYIELYETLLK